MASSMARQRPWSKPAKQSLSAVILGRAVRRCREQRCCFKDGVCDVAGWRPRRSAAGLANRYPTTTHDADGGVVEESATYVGRQWSSGLPGRAATVPAQLGLPGALVSRLQVRPGAAGWLASCQSARSMAYQATTVPAMGSSPWKRRPHFSITRRDAALVAMVALMIRSRPTVSKP